MSISVSLLSTFLGCFRSRVELQLELLALRQQIHVLKRSRRSRPRISRADRLFWVLALPPVGRVATDAHDRPAGDGHRLASPRLSMVLDLEESSTHRRPPVLYRHPSIDSHHVRSQPPLGRAARYGELLKLGIAISPATVAKYMVRHRQPPSQTWRTFLTNHRDQIIAADFFVVPTVTYRLLFVLVLLAHIAVASCTLPSPPIRPRPGPHSNCAKPVPGTQLLDT